MNKKKASGNGTIYRTNSGWRGQLTVDKKRLSFSGKTKKEVIDKMASARTDINRGQFIFDNDITVSEWVETWLNRAVKPQLTPQSFRVINKLYYNHLIPVLGDYRLQDLTIPLLEETYGVIFQEKNDKQYKIKSYSHSTVNALSSSFKRCLQSAVDNGLLAKNPHNGVQLHKLRPPKKVFAYSISNHKKIIDYVKNGSQYNWIYYLLISTGMRFSEAVALTWDDIDLKQKTININKISVELHGSPIIQFRTKTDAGTRIISIPDNVVTFLRSVKISLDPALNYRNLVIPNTRYNIITSANTRRRWQRICTELDIPYQGVHALRHTWATRALERGVDIKTVSHMLGHKNVITTMNVYQDVFREHGEKAVKLLDDLF